MTEWKWASASCCGASHIAAGARKQDAIASFTAGAQNSVLVSVLADGAGSASHGGQGASLACRMFSQFVRAILNEKARFPDDDEVRVWVDDIRDAIALAAQRRSIELREFASTFIAVLADDEQLLCIHIGDGSVVARDSATSAWVVISWPQNGEYASSTYFLTDEPEAKIRIVRCANNFDCLAAFTDGIERLVLDFAAGLPHAQFFEPIARPLFQLEKAGKAHKLSNDLVLFLSSDRVNAKTDDDKTLLIATR